jgi:ketosteroid isomerase-like protein
MLKYLLASFLILYSSFVFSQSADEKEIRAVLNSQIISWNHGDLEKFMEGYWKNDSLMFIGKSGVTHGYQATLDRYKKNYPDADSRGLLSFDLLEIKELSPEYYWVLGKWHLKRKAGDTGGHYTLLFKKIKGKWKVIADHSS